MIENDDPQATRCADFRRLHESGLFVLPNPWDVGSARYLEAKGFAALATTSSGFAFSRGRADGALGVDEILAHAREIAGATALPVNADFEDGHATDLDGLSRNVRLCVETGVAGISIEDATGDASAPLYSLDVAADRIRVAKRAIAGTGVDVLLVGRAECFLTGHQAPFDEAVRRLTAYASAGADCLYAPGVTRADEIAAIVRAVVPKPVNVLLRPEPFPSIGDLERMGVRRVSVGGALALAAWEGLARAVERLQARQPSAKLSLSNGDLNALFGHRDDTGAR